MNFSPKDLEILALLQRDSSQSMTKMSDALGMSQSTLWRKINEFEASGVIQARVALLDPAKVGCKLTVLASITLNDHSEDALAGFARLVTSRPEIVECHATSGQADYSLKIRVADVEAYEHFMTHMLLRSGFVREVQSSFVLKELKATTAMPL